MVASTFIAKFKIAGAAFAALIGLATSQPVLANSAAAADIMAPLRTAQSSRTNDISSDAEFSRLFNSWQALDNGSAIATAPVRSNGSVAIPSLMPVDGVRFTSGFGMRSHPVLGGRRAHKGIDLAGATGTPIRASADGVVSRAEWFSSYGLYVQLEHGGAIETRYGHMSRLNVAPGQTVKKGDVIGYIGSTGRSTGPHLHYEVRVAGEAVDPTPYMREDQLDLARTSTDRGATGVGGE